MGLFVHTTAPTPSPTPTVTYVRVQPIEMRFLEWAIQIVLMYVVVRDFFVYVVPWLARLLSVWVEKSFPSPIDLTQDAAELVEELAESAAESTVAAATGAPSSHMAEELARVAEAGGAGLVRRLVSEL